MHLAIEEIQDILQQILAATPAGLTEHALLQALAARELEVFEPDDTRSMLGLFQRHFLLFHCLYGLRDRLRTAAQADLEIHCLNIRLLPYTAIASEHPAAPDNLAAYYLDLHNLESADEEVVSQLLDEFWQRYNGAEHRGEALAVMELENPASYDEIKRQYRRLAMQRHPDRGGDPEQFHRLEWAMGILKALYQ